MSTGVSLWCVRARVRACVYAVFMSAGSKSHTGINNPMKPIYTLLPLQEHPQYSFSHFASIPAAAQLAETINFQISAYITHTRTHRAQTCIVCCSEYYARRKTGGREILCLPERNNCAFATPHSAQVYASGGGGVGRVSMWCGRNQEKAAERLSSRSLLSFRSRVSCGGTRATTHLKYSACARSRTIPHKRRIK